MNDTSTSQLQVLDSGLLEYGEALNLQEALVAERIAGLSLDRIVLVEHPPVVTIGRSGSLKELRVSEEALKRRGATVYHVDRGGMATFHGPGQLVAYPIIKLQEKDLHLYLQRLLEVVATVVEEYGLKPEIGVRGPGIWVSGAKIASVGIATRKWVTYHGIALNVNTQISWFSTIDPCGYPDERITSMERELGRPLDMEKVKERFVEVFCRIFGYPAMPEIRRLNRPRPRWLVLPSPCRESVERMESLLDHLQLGTVCQSARCPNLGECFGRGTATFMILGRTCTRRCRFCAVGKGSPEEVEEGEPDRVAEAVASLGITHAVVTSVTRDDLPDGGAGQFVKTIEAIKKRCPGVTVEVLVPDFQGSSSAIESVCNARPDVFNHNLETVERLYPDVRPRAQYQRSLDVLEQAACSGLVTKSGIMLGLGETHHETLKTIKDLRAAGCWFLTLGQYLSPSIEHLPVARYVTPEEFKQWEATALTMGFKGVAAGPLVRSSYRAERMVSSARRCDTPKEQIHVV